MPADQRETRIAGVARDRAGQDRSGPAERVFRLDDVHVHYGTAAVLLVVAIVASLLGVVVTLDLAGRQGGPLGVLLIGMSVLTVVLSWTVVNTVYTLRYADLYYRSRDVGIAFTIGMCY